MTKHILSLPAARDPALQAVTRLSRLLRVMEKLEDRGLLRAPGGQSIPVQGARPTFEEMMAVVNPTTRASEENSGPEANT